MVRLLLLEDDDDLRSEIADFLTSEGHQVIDVGSIAAHLEYLDQIDIAIIDAGLPDGDGFDVAYNLRQSHPEVGIIMLTARGGISDKIRGLKGGADQYLVKPVKFNVLSAYITSMVRRITPQMWQLNITARLLISPNGKSSNITSLEMTLLKLLASNAGKIVPRPSIAKAFGSEWLDYDERHLDQLVSRLRKRWQSRTGEPLPLRTEHGRGYSFCTDVQVI